MSLTLCPLWCVVLCVLSVSCLVEERTSITLICCDIWAGCREEGPQEEPGGWWKVTWRGATGVTPPPPPTCHHFCPSPPLPSLPVLLLSPVTCCNTAATSFHTSLPPCLLLPLLRHVPTYFCVSCTHTTHLPPARDHRPRSNFSPLLLPPPPLLCVQ